MSKQGLQKFAKILSDMQTIRLKLLEDPKEHQDLRLGQLLEKMKEFVKEEFCKITFES